MGLVSNMEIVVRSTEIDVNGHVNNAKYLEYLEWGREDWYERCGFDYDTLKQLGVLTVVVHVSADYRREAFQNDLLQIRTWLARVGNTSMTMCHAIDNQNKQRVLDAEFVIVTVHPESRQKVTVPNSFRQQITAVDD